MSILKKLVPRFLIPALLTPCHMPLLWPGDPVAKEVDSGLPPEGYYTLWGLVVSLRFLETMKNLG